MSSVTSSSGARRPAIGTKRATAWALRLALAGTLSALAIAYASEHWGGLAPCVLCLYQRAAHGVAATLAGLGLLGLRFGLAPVLAAAPAGLALLGSAGIAGFHVGVEFGWWQGLEACAGPNLDFSKPISDLTTSMLNAPVVHCDQVPWAFLGLSIAGWNLVFSLGLALIVFWAATRRSRA